MTAKMFLQKYNASKNIFAEGYTTTISDSELIKLLQDFATIKCKEQRELCGIAIQENNYYSNMHGEIYETIMTTKQPEI